MDVLTEVNADSEANVSTAENLDDKPCTEYIYSDDYLAYLVKYDNDLRGVWEVMKPDCVDVINSRFLVSYKKAPDIGNPESFFEFGYGALPKVYGLMDLPAVEDIGAYAVRRLPGLDLSGNGVVIGFVDTGIDYRNPAFFDSSGRTRIRYIWDQSQEVYGSGPAVFGYGAEFTGDDINRANVSDTPYQLVPTRDQLGHGTFLASLGAGAEALEDNFSGVAPEAEIIMVKLKPAPKVLKDFYCIEQMVDCYSEVDITQAIRYLIQRAISLGKPMVICLGIGTNQGGHDGSSYLELYMESLSVLRGICFVAPAGNELVGRHHYTGNLSLQKNIFDDQNQQNPGGNQGNFGLAINSIGMSGGMENIEINVASGVPGFTMEIWGQAPGLLRLSVMSPSGETVDGPAPNQGGSSYGDFLFEGGSVFIENVVVEQTTGDQVLFLRFSNPGQGIWRLQVSEALNQLGGGFNAWLPIEVFIGDQVTFVKSYPELTVTSPGNGRGCITAATYNGVDGAIYPESSRGFTRRGNVKPDITAPGVSLKGVLATTGDSLLYTRKSGSSAATAILAGASALMLQWGIVKGNNLAMNTENIKQLFIRGARRKEEYMYPSEIWGWGILDILQTFQNMRQ